MKAMRRATLRRIGRAVSTGGLSLVLDRHPTWTVRFVDGRWQIKKPNGEVYKWDLQTMQQAIEYAKWNATGYFPGAVPELVHQKPEWPGADVVWFDRDGNKQGHWRRQLMATDYEEQRRKILVNMAMLRSVGPDYVPTPAEFVMNALGYDPSQDGLYLCDQCGITHDHECDYGGWHTAEQSLVVQLRGQGDPGGD